METLLPIDSCHVSRHAKPRAPTGEVSIRSECISREIEAWTTRGDHVTPWSTDTWATIALSHVPDTFAGATYPTTTAPETAAIRASETYMAPLTTIRPASDHVTPRSSEIPTNRSGALPTS